MRRVLFFLLFICGSVSIFTQSIIENSEKPLNKNAGRSIELQKVYQIDDPGDKFFFQYPSNLKIAPDNSIFLKDSEQLLQFNPSGEFVKNYYKKGQGPGEMTYIGTLSFLNRGIIVQNLNPTKMMWFDISGELKKEFVIHNQTGLKYLFYSKGNYYFIQSKFPRITGEPQIVDSLETLVEINENGNLTKLADLPTKKYVVIGKGGGSGWLPLNNLITASYKDRYLFISHRQEYSIKIFDADINQIIKIIKREYPRVKQTKEDLDKQGGPIIDGKQMLPPPQKYVNDIENLFVVGKNLWVQTSLKDKKSRTLFDVFDFNGKFIDNFFILLPKELGPYGYNVKPIHINNGFLIAIEKNPDESLSVVRYGIIDKWIQ